MVTNNEVGPYTTTSHHLWDPYVKGLRIFKALGLPLKITVTEGHIVFEDHLRFLKFGVIMGKTKFKTSNSTSNNGVCNTYFAIVALTLVCSAYGGIQAIAVDMEEIMVVFEKHGFSSNITITCDTILICTTIITFVLSPLN